MPDLILGQMLVDAGAAKAVLPIGVTVALATAVALAALLGRHGMPAGLAEGTFITAVSGIIILLLAVDSTDGFQRAPLGHVLTGLTVLWHVVGRLVARPRARGRTRQEAAESEHSRSLIWTYAALACGLGAAVNVLSMPAWSTAGAIDLLVLLVLSGLVWVLRTGPGAAYPAIALLAGLLILLVPVESLRAQALLSGAALNAAALLCLLIVIGTILLDWHRRRREWLRQPARLTTSPPARSGLCAVLVGMCVGVGLGGLLFRESWFTPTAVWMAALTCLVIGHLRAWLLAGEIGLVLVAVGVVSAAMAWLTPGWSGALLGLVVAGGYLLWLARFWDQQLNEGKAWTTAGRLIPVSRRLGYAASSAALAAAMGGAIAGQSATQEHWIAGTTLLLLVLAMALLVRDGFQHQQPGAAAGACFLMLAAAGAVSGLLTAATATPVDLFVGVAVGAVVLALGIAAVTPRVLRSLPDLRRGAATTGRGAAVLSSGSVTVYVAHIGGVLPVATLFVLSGRGLTAQTGTAFGLVLAAVVVGALRLRASVPLQRATGGPIDPEARG